MEGDGFFDDGHHHKLVALARVKFEELFQVRKELSALSHLLVGLLWCEPTLPKKLWTPTYVFDGVDERNICIKDLTNLLSLEL